MSCSMLGVALCFRSLKNKSLRASEAAAQCIVIGPVCLFVGVCLCVFVGLLPR